jgi:hypothetical protein
MVQQKLLSILISFVCESILNKVTDRDPSENMQILGCKCSFNTYKISLIESEQKKVYWIRSKTDRDIDQNVSDIMTSTVFIWILRNYQFVFLFSFLSVANISKTWKTVRFEYMV